MDLKTTKYRVLIQQHKNMIYSYSMYMMKNKMDADDVTQEVMIKIWQNIDKFNVMSAKSWILKSTHNLCIDYLRRLQVNNNRSLEIDEVFIDTYSDNNEANDPYKKVHLNIMSEKLKEAVKKLPENLRSILVLYEIQGFKYKEISKILNIPVNSVKVYLFRARKKLQEELKVYEANEVI